MDPNMHANIHGMFGSKEKASELLRIRRIRRMSLGVRVTRLAWIAAHWPSSIILTKYASAAACMAGSAWADHRVGGTALRLNL